MKLSLPLIFLSFSYIALADWQMFADKDNTYLYNTLTGEVYIKHSMGGENYEDVFVKMPKGISSHMNLPSKKNANKQNDLEALPLEKPKPNAPIKKPTKPESKNIDSSSQTNEQKARELENDLKTQSIKKAQEMMLKTLDSGGL